LPFGHQRSRFTPLGIATNAMRRGAAAPAAAAALGAPAAASVVRLTSDGIAGRATQAPSPRKNRRRLKAHWRSSMRFRFANFTSSMVHLSSGCQFAPLADSIVSARAGALPLKRRGFHDTSQQLRKLALPAIQSSNDFIHRMLVI